MGKEWGHQIDNSLFDTSFFLEWNFCLSLNLFWNNLVFFYKWPQGHETLPFWSHDQNFIFQKCWRQQNCELWGHQAFSFWNLQSINFLTSIQVFQLDMSFKIYGHCFLHKKYWNHDVFLRKLLNFVKVVLRKKVWCGTVY